MPMNEMQMFVNFDNCFSGECKKHLGVGLVL